MRTKKFECEHCQKQSVCKYVEDMDRINSEILDIVQKEFNIYVSHIIFQCLEYRNDIIIKDIREW